jgi:hypothetical protein
MQRTFQRSVPLSQAVYWSSYFDPDHLPPMLETAVGPMRVEVLEDEARADGSRRRRIRVIPEFRGVPIIQKLFGERRAYLEEGDFDAEQQAWRYQVTPSALADRIRLHGTHTTRAIGDRETEVHIRLEVEVRLPVIGGVLERWVAGQFMEGCARQVAFTTEWGSRRPSR